MKVTKIITLICGIFLLASCMRDVQSQDPNTESDYDYVQANLVTSNGTWKNNWITKFDSATISYIPEIKSRQYKGLELFIKPFKGEDVVFGECVTVDDDPNLFIEIWVCYNNDGTYDLPSATSSEYIVPEEAVIVEEVAVKPAETPATSATVVNADKVVQSQTGEKAFLITKDNMDDYLVATNYANTRIRLDFDNLPPNTTRLAIKLLKGRTSGYITPKFVEN